MKEHDELVQALRELESLDGEVKDMEEHIEQLLLGQIITIKRALILLIKNKRI